MLTLLPLLDIFVVFMVCIRLVKSLFGPCLVISFSFFSIYTYFGVCIIILIIIYTGIPRAVMSTVLSRDSYIHG